MRANARPWLLALALWQLVEAAAAQPRFASVTLVQEPCAAYDPTELARLLQLELSARGVGALQIRDHLDDPPAADSGLAVLRVQCDAEHARAVAEVDDLTTGTQTRREIPLADLAPSTRARALSLAVAALVDASWYELALREPPEQPEALPDEVASSLRQRIRSAIAPPPSAAAPPRAPPPSLPEAALALLLAGRSYPTHSAGLLGIELHYTPMLTRARLSASAEALFGTHDATDSAGTIAHTQLYSFGGGLAFTWASATRPELSMGPYVRLGYAAATASQVRAGLAAHGGGGFLAIAGLSALLRAELASAWDFWFGFDVGYAFSGVVFQAGPSESTGLADLTLALRVGVSLRL